MASNRHSSGKCDPDPSLSAIAAASGFTGVGGSTCRKRARSADPFGGAKKHFAQLSRAHDDTYILSRQDIPSRNGYANAPTNHAASGMGLNPAMLLNPRGFAAAARTNNESGQSTPTSGLQRSSGSTASLDFHFSSPNGGTASGASTPPSFIHAHSGMSESHSPSPVNGLGTMLERLNNVQDRTTAPQPKRRKLETIELDDSADEQQNRSRFGSGGSSILGQHVKDRRGEAAKTPSLSRLNTVDLTESGTF